MCLFTDHSISSLQSFSSFYLFYYLLIQKFQFLFMCRLKVNSQKKIIIKFTIQMQLLSQHHLTQNAQPILKPVQVEHKINHSRIFNKNLLFVIILITKMMLVLHQKCLTQVSDMFLVLIILTKVFICYGYFSPTVSKRSGHTVVLWFSVLETFF